MTKQSNPKNGVPIGSPGYMFGVGYSETSLLPPPEQLEKLKLIDTDLIDIYKNYVRAEHKHQMAVDFKHLELEKTRLQQNDKQLDIQIQHTENNKAQIANNKIQAESNRVQVTNETKEINRNFFINVLAIFAITFLVCFILGLSVLCEFHNYHTFAMTLASTPIVAIVIAISKIAINKWQRK